MVGSMDLALLRQLMHAPGARRSVQGPPITMGQQRPGGYRHRRRRECPGMPRGSWVPNTTQFDPAVHQYLWFQFHLMKELEALVLFVPEW